MQRHFVESLQRSGTIDAKACQKGMARRYPERLIQTGSKEGPVRDALMAGAQGRMKEFLEGR
jgi:hypothetical protein